MMSETTKYRVGLIGLGRPHSENARAWGMAHAHVKGYLAQGNCEIVALCDIITENAQLFNQEHAEGKATVYTDYHQMIKDMPLDVVSVCTPPALHAPMTIAAAQARVKAVHCEKPMAPTWGEARRMAEACRENGVQLTFNHQRRFLPLFQKTRSLIQEGAIGQLVRMEASCPNLMDWGTHWLNMFLFYNEETPARWVIGQVDTRRLHNIYGVPHENQGLSLMEFANGVIGLFASGDNAERVIGCAHRLIGSEGMIEIHNAAPHLRLKRKADSTVASVEVEGGLHGDHAVTSGIIDLLNSLSAGTTPLLDVSNALPTTEIIFATYESSRRRGRIDLPLDIDDHPLAG
jgi:predicted dehydrogenase